MKGKKIIATALVAPAVVGVLPTNLSLQAEAATLSGQPVLASIDNGGNVILSWSAVNGAESYDVKRDGVLIGNVTGTGFVDTATQDGRSYSYTIVAKNGNRTIEESTSLVVNVPINEAPVTQYNLEGNTINLATEEKTYRIGLSGFFTDPERQNLSYSVNSSNPRVATVSVNSEELEVLGLSQGSAEITVTAIDPRGASVSETFYINVIDEFPRLDFSEIDIHFSAIPNALSYNVYRNDSLVGEVTNSGELKYAYKDTGLESGKVYRYDIEPVFSDGPAEKIYVGNYKTLDLELFSFVSGNDVTVSWLNTVGAEGYKVVFKDESGQVLYTKEVDAATSEVSARFEYEGVYTYEVTPKYDGLYGSGQSKQFTIENDADIAPFSAPMPNLEMTLNEESKTVILSEYFSDLDGDKLTYTVESSDTGVVVGSVQDGTLTLNAVGKGVSTITVVADDGRGKTTTESFDMNVLNEAPVGSDIPAKVMKASDNPLVFDLSPYFNDVDDAVLQYEAYSTNIRIAKVISDGPILTIDPESVGTIDVVVKVSDGETTTESTFKVTVEEVLPQAVENLRWMAPAYNDARIAFDVVENADQYIIKRDGVEITRIEGNYYQDTTVTENKSYKYEVIPVNEVGEGEVKGITVTTPAKPVVENVKSTVNGTSVSLTWDALDIADFYRIEIFKKDQSGNFQPYSYARSTSSLSYEISGLEAGGEYQFKVVPRVNWEYKSEFAGVSEAQLAALPTNDAIETDNTTDNSKVQNIKVSSKGNNAANLSWSRFSIDGVNASGYRIQTYVKTTDGTFVKEGFARTTTGTSYTMSNLTEGKEYKFEITPRTNVYLTDSANMSGEIKIGSTEEVVSEEPEQVVEEPTENVTETETAPVETSAPVLATVTSSNVSLSWDALDGVSYYRVQRYELVNGEYVKDGFAKTVLGTSYKDTTSLSGTYKYILTPRVGYVYDSSKDLESNVITL